MRWQKKTDRYEVQEDVNANNGYTVLKGAVITLVKAGKTVGKFFISGVTLIIPNSEMKKMKKQK